MSPIHTPWTIHQRMSPAYLNGLRVRAENGVPIEPFEVRDLVDEINHLYDNAVAECYVEQPLPRIDDLEASAAYSLTRTWVTILARRVDQEEWMGVKAESVHAMIGRTKKQVKDYLDEVVGE